MSPGGGNAYNFQEPKKLWTALHFGAH